MLITTVLFDLGSTLIYAKKPWEPIYVKADSARISSLHLSGIPVKAEAFVSEYGGFINSYYACQGNNHTEKTAMVALQEVLESEGFFDTPKEVLRSALDAMYAITQMNWFLEDDALPTLDQLRKRGLRLGLISNTSDEKNVQHLVDRWNIRSYMDFLITSASRESPTIVVS
jgi:FMN phosphatase YigB (HAD superfamily)